MNHAHYRNINVPLHKTIIKSCKCYAEYWKELKEKAKPYVPFDYSIEKVFTYRKYFANLITPSGEKFNPVFTSNFSLILLYQCFKPR